METTIKLTSETVPLAGLLKLAGVVDSGGQAKQVIQAGHVRVNGAPETRRGLTIRPGDIVDIDFDEAIRITVT